MKPQEMIDVIQAYADGKSIETNDGGPDWWPVLSPQFNFSRFTYRVKPAAPAMWQYYRRNYECFALDANDDDCKCWWDEGTGPAASARHDDKSHITWRPANLPAPVALRPHWPAVVISSNPDGTTRYSISALLFAKPEDLIGKDGVLRLATEYPPVMLP